MDSSNLNESFNSLFQLRDEMMAGLAPYVEAAQGSTSSNFDSDSECDVDSDIEDDACSETSDRSDRSDRSTSSCGSLGSCCSYRSNTSIGKAFGLVRDRKVNLPMRMSMTAMDLGKAFMFPTMATWAAVTPAMAGASVGSFSTMLPMALGSIMPLALPKLTAFVATASGYQFGFSQSAALTAALLYIWGLKGLSQHETASMGNWVGIIASVLGVCSVLFGPQWAAADSARFFATAALASALGLWCATQVEMENMPELVAGFHSFVGLAATFAGFATFFGHWSAGSPLVGAKAIETIIGVGVGAFTFTGSVVAAGKLAGKIPGRPIEIPARAVQYCLSAAAGIGFSVLFALNGVSHGWQLMALGSNALIAAYMGCIVILPVGGADMPIVVSLLNAISGIATASAGFMLDNSLLVISGAVIASSGAFLSEIMCKGINRSLGNVMLGGFGVEPGTVVAVEGDEGPQEIREITPEELGEKMAKCKRVLIVPGFGMAVSRCQAKIAEIASTLKKCGISVSFGIHPVAGRLPGHMNVLLAEADVPYDFVKEMDEVNPKIESYDLGIVVGANDIVNPATATDPTSPIYGMPAIEIWNCKECVVLKRSMATGYSGVSNPLFHKPNVMMCFGDAKATTDRVMSTISSLEESLEAKFQAQAQGTVSDEEPDHEDEHPVVYPEIKKTIGVLTEVNDARVSITPKLVTRLRNMGFGLCIQRGCGLEAGFTDLEFTKASRGKTPDGLDSGIEYAGSSQEVFNKSDVLLLVSTPTPDQLQMLNEKHTLLCLFNMFEKEPLLEQLKSTGATVINMGLVPRISRAQKLDALTSMANIAGYRAVVEAFHTLPRFSRASATASGHIAPSKILIIGAGVAGLSAIATANSLGAEVYATDVRSAAKEQVEAMGAKFVDPGSMIAGEGAGGYAGALKEDAAEMQRKMYAKVIKKMDVVVTTALIPSRKAPLIITSEMVRSMKPGSVVVDLAAPCGGNCALTVPDETIEDKESQVTIIGTCNFAEQMPAQASDLLGSNFVAMLDTIGGATDWNLDFDDVVIQKSTVIHDKQIVYDPTPPPQPKKVEPDTKPQELPQEIVKSNMDIVLDFLDENKDTMAVALGLAASFTLGIFLPQKDLHHLGYFLLSTLVGHFTVAKVNPALHTPLIAVTNAISGIIVVGGMLQIGGEFLTARCACALLAVFFGSVNIVGGFTVSHRMLKMFRSDKSKSNSRPSITMPSAHA